MSHIVNLDFETWSKIDLKKVGVTKYATDRSTDITCFAYSIDYQEPKLWTPGKEFPYDFKQVIENPDTKIYAYNATFEILIWLNVGTKRYNYPFISFNQWRDTQAIALNFGLPLTLKNCGDILNLDIQKDSFGSFLVANPGVCSQPQKLTKKVPHVNKLINEYDRPDIYREFENYYHNKKIVFTKKVRFFRKDFPLLYEANDEYCKQDVRSEQAILKHLPFEMSDRELEHWRFTFKKNQRGIPIDLDLVESIIDKNADYIEDMEKFLGILTNKEIKTLNQRDKIINWAAKKGYKLPDLTANTVKSALKDKNIEKYPEVKSILELRQKVGKSSIKKFVKMKEAVCTDGRLHDCALYHGAITGRDTGRLFQPLNLPRASVPDIEHCVSAFKHLNYHEIIEYYDDVLYAASAMLRPSVCAPEGKKLIVSDYSGIEHRVICWLAGQHDVIELMETGKDLYVDMASALYNRSYDDIINDLSKDHDSIEYKTAWKQRFHGKVVILGCDYGMGKNTFITTCANFGLDISEEEAERSVDIFRKRYDKIPKLWYGLLDQAIKAVKNKEQVFEYGYLKCFYSGDFLYLILPNNKFIAYLKPELSWERMPWGKMKETLLFLGNINKQGGFKKGRVFVTPGRLTENACQGTAREPLFEAKLDLENKGYKIILDVYDEVVCEVPDTDEYSINEVNQILCNRSHYFDGLPLHAEGFETYRYKKG